MTGLPFIDIHTHLDSGDLSGSIRIFNIDIQNREKPEPPLFSAGLHPWDLSDPEKAFENLLILVKNPGCAAIGEAGLDSLKGPSLSIQEEWFDMQARLAAAVSKPLIIHCVRAWNEIIRIRKSFDPGNTWVVHGFRGNRNRAKALLDAGFYLSFGAHIIRNDPSLTEAFRYCPADRIFLETDESPVGLGAIYEGAALIRSVSLDQIKLYISENFNRTFHLDGNSRMA